MIKLDTIELIQSFNEQTKYLQTGLILQDGFFELSLDNGQTYQIPERLFPLVKVPEPKYNPILYGKNGLEGIVGAESDGDELYLFIQKGSETITKMIPNKLWLAALKNHDGQFQKLEGDRQYKYIKYYKDFEKWDSARKMRYQLELQCSYCPIESNFISRGLTYFKGLQISQVPVLSFDIETDGLVKNSTSDIYLISNTFRSGDFEENRLFDFHDYPTRKAMLEDWAKWVREKNPAILLGHNIYGYDFPYLKHVADLNDASLDLGRDGSSLKIDGWESKFRKDGHEKIFFNRARVWGREIVDTFFLSYKYDIGKKYDSNGLKQIIKQEGLEKQGRTYVEAGKIKNYLNNPTEWAKICQYAREDSDDALKLFDLMGPSFFYYAQTIPMKFESVINGASGAQLNSMLLRAYLQDGESIPKASNTQDAVAGGMSYGVPGIYRNVQKFDVSSQYPSIIREYKLFNPKKDPKGYYYYITDLLTQERLKNKALGKTDKYYKDLEQSQKISINSLYGLTNTAGLNFNDPKIAEFITSTGREIINSAIYWATGKFAEDWGWSETEAMKGKDV